MDTKSIYTYHLIKWEHINYYDMEINNMENWNPNDWQGRRKDQYEWSAKVVFYSIIAFVLLTLTSLLLS